MSGTLSGFASGPETELYGIGSGEAAQPPLPSVLGNAFSSVMIDENPTARLFGAMRRNINDREAALGRGTSPLLTAEEANEKYGIPGILTFSAPLAESSAVALRERAQDRAAREDISSRAQSGVMGWTARGAVSLAAAALDPLSVASAFVPVVGEVRAAAWLAQATSRVGRIGAAIRIGAVEGVAGAAMLEPVNHLLAASEARQDYGMADSLLNVAFGAGFGALLHGAGRGIIDGFRGWSPDGRLATEAHESAVRAAVAQMQRGDPVDVRPIFDAGRAAAPDVTPRAPDVTTPEAPAMTPEQAIAAWRTSSLSDAMNPDGIGNLADVGRAVPPGWMAHGSDTAGMLNMLRNGVDPERQLYTGDFSGAAGQGVSAATHRPLVALFAPGEQTDAIRAVVVNMQQGGEQVAAALRREFPDVTFLLPDEVVPFTRGEMPARDAPAPNPEAIRATVEQAARPVVRPADATAVAQAEAARVRSEAGARVETPVARTDAATARLDAEIADTDRVLTELVRTGRITEAEAQAVRAPEAEALTAERVKGIEAAAACMIANGA